MLKQQDYTLKKVENVKKHNMTPLLFQFCPDCSLEKHFIPLEQQVIKLTCDLHNELFLSVPCSLTQHISEQLN